MLLRFSFTNFRSFRAPTVLPFAATRHHASSAQRFPAPGTKHGVVPALALYGANASGKTSAVRALEAMIKHVRHSTELKDGDPISFQPFRLDDACPATPARYEIDFVVDNVRYHYGFVHTDKVFEEEWLFAWPKGHEQLWFHRTSGDSWYFGGGLKGKLKTLASFTGANHLFLSAAEQNKHDVLTPIHRWLVRAIVFSPLGLAHSTLWRSTSSLFDPQSLSRVLQLLKLADFGICDARVESREESLQRLLQAKPGVSVPEDLTQRLREDGPPKELVLQHQGKEGGAWLPPSLESTGTVTLLNRLHEMLPVLDHGGLYVADELDRSLHPELTAAIIALFKDTSVNRHGAQLLFTTHDTTLLNHLERDEVCLVEKDAQGVSRLTPLSDFRVAKRDDVERDYRIGRYGAIPRIGPLAAALGGSHG